MTTNRLVFSILRDVLHESAYNQCQAQSDICETWEPAWELADLIAGSANPDGFEIWHAKWYNRQRTRKSTVRERIHRRARTWWHVR
jgi:hypothetical protein